MSVHRPVATDHLIDLTGGAHGGATPTDTADRRGKERMNASHKETTTWL